MQRLVLSLPPLLTYALVAAPSILTGPTASLPLSHLTEIPQF